MHAELPEARMELMLWASERGQMLSRTVKGMMMYGSALRQLELLESPDFTPLHGSSAADGKFRCAACSAACAALWASHRRHSE